MGVETELGKLNALLTQLLATGIPITTGDIEIGAIEVKNDTDDTRAKVGAGLKANGLRITVATDDPQVVATGTTADAFSTDHTATGTLLTFVKGLIATLKTLVVLGAGSNVIGLIGSSIQTLTTNITRPTDTAPYAANDALASSTSAPTVGGITFANAARASGGSGRITDAIISASAGSAIQGELWLFDQAVTAVNDNAAFTVSDSDVLNLVGIIPFNISDVTAANAVSYVTGLNIGFTCVGSANLRGLVKVMAAVTPGNAEVISFRLKVQN